MAAQNKPNFALFMSSDLDFLTDKPFTDQRNGLFNRTDRNFGNE